MEPPGSRQATAQQLAPGSSRIYPLHFSTTFADKAQVMNPLVSKANFTADDWGMSPGINAAILEMAMRGLIKRVSILAGSPFVKHGLDELLQIPGLQFGLHFNLTLFPPLFEEQQDAFSPFMDTVSFHYKPLWKLNWIWLSPFHRSASRAAAFDAFKGQLEKLRTLKVPVSYFDGHQNVHLLPGLLTLIHPELVKWGIKETTIPSPWTLLPARKFRLAFRAFRARRAARHLGLHTRPFWRPSLRALSATRRVQKKITRSKNGIEILVHPSVSNDLEGYGIRDRYRKGRVREYQALSKLLRTHA